MEEGEIRWRTISIIGGEGLTRAAARTMKTLYLKSTTAKGTKFGREQA